ncbi:MAG: FapA family protein [Treponema sp.]|jgi:uncharacterized protein (DUF342 family)|nr:FapA family protein [Treponema sp.]
MVSFVRLQQIVRTRLEQDRNIQIVTTTGATLEAAVAEAAVLLDLPIRKLEYEITEKGESGFLGRGKKNWAIKAYPRVSVSGVELEGAGDLDDGFDMARINEDADGDVFINLSSDGVFLKAVPPRGRGHRATDSEAIALLNSRHVSNFDRALVSMVVKNAEGEYVRVGEFEYQPTNDSMVTVEISDTEMKALITVTPPGVGGCDISVETYLSFLKNNRVLYGIKEDYLREFADRPIYKEKIVVAEGLPAVDGRNAYIQYNFETDQTKIKLREGSNGRIDFKDTNIIKNVVENQPLARKIPAEQGTMGYTVTGKVIHAANGKDIPILLGKNVRIGDDGATIIADMNGQVIVAGGKINVEPVYTVDGDVNLKTGNIIFLGAVEIKGNVEDGFSVKAAGNIVVNGTVGKAELDAEGDIIVNQGITGKSEGVIRAGKSIWARFIENAIIEAGNMVVVSDGIINSQIDAFKRIICRGKRAHLVGGRLRASEDINAKILGSPTSGTETVCEVGIDPKSKEQLENLAAKKIEMEKQLEELQLNLQTLISIKKQRKSLPEDKEVQMGEFMDRRQILMTDLQKNKEEAGKIQEILNTIKTRGKVSASSKVYPGVKIIIRDALNDIRTEYKAVTFVLENNLIRVVKYEEPDEDVKKGPDGYTAD